MVRAPVDAVVDGIGRASSFVMQSALDRSAKDRLCGPVAVKREALGFVTPVKVRAGPDRRFRRRSGTPSDLINPIPHNRRVRAASAARAATSPTGARR